MYSRFISRQNLAALVTPDEDNPDEVQVILASLLELGIIYSERRRPSFSKAVVQLQRTDPTSWTSQAGLVEVEVEAGKLVKQPGGKLARSQPAIVKCGEECKPFNPPALRVVPSVAVCHSEATPKPKQGQQETAGVAKVSETVMPQAANQSCSKSASAALQAAHSSEVANLDKGRRATAGGVANFSESSIVMPPPANHSFSKSASLASVKVKYDSKEHVNLRRKHT